MNTYSIVMLGLSGSGKTVFLASLYKKLSTQGDAGFFLEADGEETGNRLIDLYSEIAFGEKWPSRTALDIPEWTFTCQVQTKNLPIYSACRFTYIDYAGGRLTGEFEEDNAEFYNKLKNSDVMLGLLDGQQILALMQKKTRGMIWATKELPKMLSLMQKSAKPIQFLISKWDLIEAQYSLQEVRDLLLSEVDEFKNLVKNQNKAGLPIRLIPVSAVGKGFATMQPNGLMLKKPGVLPKPFQVEFPLACVLPDLIQAEYNRLEKQKQEIKTAKTEVKANLNFFEQVGQIVGEGLKVVAELAPVFIETFLPKKYEFATASLQKMIHFTSELAQSSANQKQEIAKRRTEELRQEREETLAKVTDEHSALEYALDCFLLLQTELYKNFPASEIKLP